jgi:hypothetical protein
MPTQKPAFVTNKAFIASILLTIMVFIDVLSQETFYTDHIYRPTIKSVQLHRAGWDMTYPIIELNSADQLELRFDDLTDEVKNYSYTIEHCNADWMPSHLSVDEYIDGFNNQPVQDYSLSFNTHVHYVHYKVVLPNDDMGIRISGNYILKIFEDFDENNLVLVQRFSVAEPLVSIHGNAGRPVSDPYRDDGHQVSFKVLLGSVNINDPYSEIKIAIQQNNRWNMSIRNLKPLFISDNMLDYNHQTENIFKGGNEYRYFDIKSMRYQAEMVRNIEYQPPHYHVYLTPDKPRYNGSYFFREDLNGRYYVEVQEGVRRNTEADYVYVHFSLSLPVPVINGKLYVCGAMSNWQCDESNQMTYNFETKSYELDLLLKQGYYNYEYVFVRESSQFPDATFIEGSYYEAENDYVIYVYLTTNTSRYDRLIGYQILNSIRKNF